MLARAARVICMYVAGKHCVAWKALFRVLQQVPNWCSSPQVRLVDVVDHLVACPAAAEGVGPLPVHAEVFGVHGCQKLQGMG